MRGSKFAVAANGAALTGLRAEADAIKAKVDARPHLHFLQAAVQGQEADTAGLRDDMRVMTAISMRIDNSHGILLEELRATHAQIARMNDRVRRLEDTHTAALNPD